MYQHRNQSIKQESTKGDLFLLFNKYSGENKTRRSVSTPTSANVSPSMSDKECTEQVENDSESPEGFNPKRYTLTLL
jgi:hypothetical protein